MPQTTLTLAFSNSKREFTNSKNCSEPFEIHAGLSSVNHRKQSNRLTEPSVVSLARRLAAERPEHAGFVANLISRLLNRRKAD
jgi:hypothetical protein